MASRATVLYRHSEVHLMTGVGHGWRHHAWKYYAAFEEGGRVSDRPFSLLVIDDEFIVDLVTSVAETAGYAVASACTPVALEACLTQSWDIILLDLTMPELDTVTAFRLIAGALPGAVVAIFTGAYEISVGTARTVAGFYGLPVLGSVTKAGGLAGLKEFFGSLS